MTKKVARLEVRIPPDVKEQFSDNCINQGKNSSEVIRGFIDQFLGADEKNIDESSKNKNTFSYKILLFITLIIAGGGYYFYPSSYPMEQQKFNFQFDRFDRDHNGILTLEDFKRYRNKLMKGFSSNPDNYLMLRELSAEDRIIKLEKLRKKHSPVKRMKYYDLNQDGKVTFEEFISLPLSISLVRWDFFIHLDVDKNNYLSYDELLMYTREWFKDHIKGEKGARYFAKQAMLRDVNGDNKLSLYEFHTAPIIKNPPSTK